MTENDLTTRVLDTAFAIHKKYGPGLFESVYEELMCYELKKQDFNIRRQHPVNLVHNDLILETAFRADIIVEDRVLIELKSVETLADVHYKQVLTYLKLTHLKLGLLINFNVTLLKDGIKRIANNL